MRRRDLLITVASPALLRAQSQRPKAEQGVMIGDVSPAGAMVWSRADRPSRMIVEYATTESFRDARRITGSEALEGTDFTARLDLRHLPADQQIFCRVQFQSLADSRAVSEPVLARFRTPPATRRNVRFVWTGDTVGQGWGINPAMGGMKGYETMRSRNPDFFVHSGDTIYADSPVLPEVKLPDGSLWRNVTTEAKSKVAETLTEFRGNYLYNLLDKNVRRFNAEVPQVWQWDDHEVMNNWSPGKDLSKLPYREKQIAVLAARGRKAFLEYAPLRFTPAETERVYRKIPYGPLLDVFVIDMRSYRAANSCNCQTAAGADTRYLGHPQLQWLLKGLRESKATWKVIASDMPLGLIVPDGKDAEGRRVAENSANGDGPPMGRELELVSLFREMKRMRVANTVWITADVHYTAAHYYNPAKAQFTDFHPFWEFVSGPIHAGTFGPGLLDNTFGPEVRFMKHPPKGEGNLPPSAGMQFFGEVNIDGKSGELTVSLIDTGGATLFQQKLQPAEAARGRG